MSKATQSLYQPDWYWIAYNHWVTTMASLELGFEGKGEEQRGSKN